MAIEALHKVQMLEPRRWAGLDVRAHCLYREKRGCELQRLVAPLLEGVLGTGSSQPLAGPEAWVAVGYYALLRKQPVRANHLAVRANSLCACASSAEPLLLRAAAQRQLKRLDVAVACYRDALAIQPNMFEAFEGLINCYLAMPSRKREAFTLAASACRKLGHTPRALTVLIFSCSCF